MQGGNVDTALSEKGLRQISLLSEVLRKEPSISSCRARSAAPSLPPRLSPDTMRRR